MLSRTCLILHNMDINTKEWNNCRDTGGGTLPNLNKNTNNLCNSSGRAETNANINLQECSGDVLTCSF